MKLFSMLLLSVAVLMPAVALTGCSTGGAAGLWFPQETSVFGSSTRVRSGQGMQLQRLAAKTGSEPNRSPEPRILEVNRTLPSQPERTSYLETAGSRQPAQPAASLVVLGPNDNFRELVNNASGAVLVDFYADWCGPCRNQSKILHEMESSARDNGALILKVNVDQHRELAKEFQVASLPTLMLIKHGQIVNRQSGMADHHRIAELLRQ